MKTYYQKHKRIQAFQFDGTWEQLERELPNEIWTNILQAAWHKNRIKITQSPQSQLVQKLQVYDIHWIYQTNHLQAPQYLKNSPYRRVRNHSHFKKYRQIKNVPKILHINDYITIIHVITKHRMKNKSPLFKIQHHTRFSKRMMIQIKNPQDFNAHWSKTPRKHSN